MTKYFKWQADYSDSFFLKLFIATKLNLPRQVGELVRPLCLHEMDRCADDESTKKMFFFKFSSCGALELALRRIWRWNIVATPSSCLVRMSWWAWVCRNEMLHVRIVRERELMCCERFYEFSKKTNFVKSWPRKKKQNDQKAFWKSVWKNISFKIIWVLFNCDHQIIVSFEKKKIWK